MTGDLIDGISPIRPRPIVGIRKAMRFERGCATCNASFLALAGRKFGLRPEHVIVWACGESAAS